MFNNIVHLEKISTAVATTATCKPDEVDGIHYYILFMASEKGNACAMCCDVYQNFERLRSDGFAIGSKLHIMIL